MKKRSHHASPRTPKHRDKIRKRLNCIVPVDPDSHPTDFVNVVTGVISPEMVNAHDAVSIGSGQPVSFEKSWPDGFALLSKLLLNMAGNSKKKQKGSG